MTTYDAEMREWIRRSMARMREDVEAQLFGVPHSGMYRDSPRGPGHDITAFGGSARIVDAGEQRCLPSSR